MAKLCIPQEREKDQMERLWKRTGKNQSGPSEYTDYDEALAYIRQTGSLREYQKEFERIANRVQD